MKAPTTTTRKTAAMSRKPCSCWRLWNIRNVYLVVERHGFGAALEVGAGELQAQGHESVRLRHRVWVICELATRDVRRHDGRRTTWRTGRGARLNAVAGIADKLLVTCVAHVHDRPLDDLEALRGGFVGECSRGEHHQVLVGLR